MGINAIDYSYEGDLQKRYLEYAHMDSDEKEKSDPSGAIGISLADEAIRFYGSIESFPEWLKLIPKSAEEIKNRYNEKGLGHLLE